MGCYYIYDRCRHTHTDCTHTVELNVHETIPEAEVKRLTRTDKSSDTHMNVEENKQTHKQNQEVNRLMEIFACNFEMAEVALQLPKASE